jgi:2,4'-dihydroxyacetophenone dioxygenase
MTDILSARQAADILSARQAEEARIDLVRDQYAIPEGYVDGSDDSASPWVPYDEGIWFKYLTFDVRSGSMANLLRMEPGAKIARHRHRGPVSGITLEGSWRYAEYDWVARAGDWIRESPGRAHTLVTEEGMKTCFWLNGSLEMLDENDVVISHVDVFWYMDHYLQYCKSKGIAPNEQLFL